MVRTNNLENVFNRPTPTRKMYRLIIGENLYFQRYKTKKVQINEKGKGVENGRYSASTSSLKTWGSVNSLSLSPSFSLQNWGVWIRSYMERFVLGAGSSLLPAARGSRRVWWAGVGSCLRSQRWEQKMPYLKTNTEDDVWPALLTHHVLLSPTYLSCLCLLHTSPHTVLVNRRARLPARRDLVAREEERPLKPPPSRKPQSGGNPMLPQRLQ